MRVLVYSSARLRARRRDIKRPLQSLETTLFFSLHLFLDFVLLSLLPFVSICIPFVS